MTKSDWSLTKWFVGAVVLAILVLFIIPALVSDPSDTGVGLAIIITLGLVWAALMVVKRVAFDENPEKKGKSQ